ncbi:hypothetical protein JWG45_07615 [Leptospira sp. 201903070]|uniref:Uncharacterized protein n=1 Tax=Leptospira ainlahdjerensis TaxID=2810033 RepID=A0ABS2U9I1_9LEPT|nr:hypothetical protein [Leptospira ainlahdjerensis]MBM9577020.1 hypothetical protein [Leptospira ainlahdjerensis]
MKDTQLEQELLEAKMPTSYDLKNGEALLQDILRSFESFDRALGNTVKELFPLDEIK